MALSNLVSAKSWLILICLFFLLTRLYKIADIPASVYWDEASIGYNAYSIAETGKDEWGEFLPLHFRAFGEFKLPVYIYAVVPFVKIFGLNAFSIRLPVALFSLGVVILTYFLARKLSGKESVGLLSSFFISVSPWFFIFSRTGYEATAGLMFYLLGLFIFLNKLSGKSLLFSVAGFILSAYSYNSFRVVSPVTFLILIIIKKEEIMRVLKKDLVYIIIAGLLLILSVIPVFRLYKYDTGGVRLQAVRATGTSLIKNYFSHFSPDFLIFNGDKNLRSQQTGFGQLYLPDLIFLSLGLLYLFTRRSKYNLLIFILMLLGPIPAAITKESPHALRSVSVIPFFAIISARGVDLILNFFKNKYLISASIIVIFLGLFFNFYFNFLIVYPSKSAKDWQYGYKKIYTDFGNQFGKYDHVLISDEYAQPYIFALFYQKINPGSFQQSVVRNSIDQWGFSTVKSFDKFIFEKVGLENFPKGKSLIFASTGEKLKDFNAKGKILNLDNSIAFYIYEYTK